MAKKQQVVMALILANIALMLAFVTGVVLMYEAVGHDNFNLNLYMVSSGIMMVTAIIAVRTVPSLKKLIWNAEKAVRNIAEQTGKFLAHGNSHKQADQQV